MRRAAPGNRLKGERDSHSPAPETSGAKFRLPARAGMDKGRTPTHPLPSTADAAPWQPKGVGRSHSTGPAAPRAIHSRANADQHFVPEPLGDPRCGPSARRTRGARKRVTVHRTDWLKRRGAASERSRITQGNRTRRGEPPRLRRCVNADENSRRGRGTSTDCSRAPSRISANRPHHPRLRAHAGASIALAGQIVPRRLPQGQGREEPLR